MTFLPNVQVSAMRMGGGGRRILAWAGTVGSTGGHMVRPRSEGNELNRLKPPVPEGRAGNLRPLEMGRANQMVPGAGIESSSSHEEQGSPD